MQDPELLESVRQQVASMPTPVVLGVVDPETQAERAIAAKAVAPKQVNWKRFGFLTAAAVLAFGIMAVAGFVIARNQKQQPILTSTYSVSAISLDDVNPESVLGLAQLGQLTLNGTIKVNGALVLTPSDVPTSPVAGQIYYDKTAGEVYYYNGQEFRSVSSTGNVGTSVNGFSGEIRLGPSLSFANGVLSANIPVQTTTAVTSVQGQTGDINFIAGTGVGIAGTTITNTGVTSVGGQTGALTVGRGLSAVGNVIASTATLTSGSANIVITDNGNGNYTISDSGVGGAGNVALGPVAAQTDSTTNPSIFIDKTGAGDLLNLLTNGVNSFVVDSSGVITNGSIAYTQVTGRPATTVLSVGGVSGAITVGTGLTLVGSDLRNAGVTSLTGTANQVSVSGATGAITLSLPQNIATTSSPTFASLSLTSALSIGNGGTGATSVGGARSALGAAASGANSDITSLTSLTVINPGAALTIGSTTQNLILQGNASTTLTATSGSFTSSLAFAAPTANQTITIPNASGTICLSSGNCPASGVGGSGTVNTIPLFSGASTVADSIIAQNGGGTLITITGDLSVTGTISGNGSGLTSLNGTNISSGTVADARLSSNVTVQGNAFNGSSQLVQTNASGQLPAINGVNLTALNGSNISSGTVADARLTANVTLQGNTFNGASQLVQLNASSQLPAVSGALLTNLNGSNISSGTVADGRLTANVTLQGNSFNGVSQLVQTNVSGQLPVISGVNLTNLNASSLASGTVNDARLSANVTVQGNTFNGANQLIQLNGSGEIPAISGVNLTNLNGSAITSGTVGVGFGGTGATTAGGARSNLGAAASGANSDITSLTGLTVINPGAALTIGNTGQNLTLQGSATTSLTATSGGFTSALVFQSPTANATITVPNETGTVCLSTGNCLGGAGGGANTALSNLASVSLNTSLLPGSTTIDLGSNSAPFQDLYIGSTATTNFRFTGVATAARTITVPDATGTLCLSTGNCAGAGSGITGSGTANTLAVFSAGQNIVDSIISQNVGATVATITGDLSVTGTISGNGSGLTSLNGTNIGSGTVADARLTSNVTVQGNSFNGVSQLVQTNGSGQLPAISGVNVTALNGTNISSGTVADARLTSNVTLQGNVFNGVSQLVQLTVAGFLPALNGSALTSLNATNISSGTVAVSVGGTGITSYTVGDILYASGATTLSTLAAPSAGQCLVSNGVGVAPSWDSCTAGGGGFTNLTLAGDSGTPQTISDTNTITLEGGTNIATVAGATDKVTISTVNNPTFSGTITASGSGTSLAVTNDVTVGGTINTASITGGSLSGGAFSGGTVTGGTLNTTSVNGVTTADIIVSTGSYVDPAWITSLAKSKVGLSNVENTALSTWAGSANLTTLGTINSGTWQAGVISDTYINDTLTVGASGSVDWSALNNYPAACGAGTAITALGDTPTCTAFAASSGSGSYIQNTTSLQSTANLYIQSTATGSVTAKFRVLGSQSADVIQVRDSADASTVFAVAPSGNVTGGTYNGATITGGTLSGGSLNATAVNGINIADIVLTTSSYADPAWITSLAKSKVGLSNVENTALSTWNGSTNITTLGTVTTGAWNANVIADAYINDSLTISSAGTVDWAALNNYPAACSAGTALTALGDTVTCTAFAAGTGSGSYIQNQNAGQQSTSNFWLSGTGRADTSFTTPLLDTATASALNIGTTNATQINLNKNTLVTGNLTFASGAGRTISLATPGTLNVSGDELSVLGATANGTGAGGALRLVGGEAPDTGAGGNVFIYGGGSDTGSAGSVYIDPGQAGSAFNPGNINIGTIAGGGTINMGNISDGMGVNILNAGTINVGTGAVGSIINLGTGAGIKTVTVGSTNTTSGTTILAGSGNINLNAATIATNQTTVALLNTTAATVNAFGAATALNLGAVTGTTTVRNTLAVTPLNAAGIVTNTAGGVLGTVAAVPVANGGTGLTSYTTGDILYASGSGTIATLTAVSAGQCLLSNGVGAAPIYGSCTAGFGLQSAYNGSTGGTTSEIVLDATRGAVDIQDRSTSNGGTLGANLFNVRATAANDATTGALLFGVGNTGAVLMQNSVDSTAAFQIQGSTSTPVLTVDTSNALTTLRGTNNNSTIGAELLNQTPPNNNFNNATYWTLGAGWGSASATNVTATTSSASVTATGSNLTVTSGRTYQVSFTVGSYSAGSLQTQIGGVTGPSVAANGSHTIVITTSNSGALQFNGNGFTGVLSNVSVKEITLSNSSLTVQSSSGVAGLELRVTSSTTNAFVGLKAGQANSIGSGTGNTGFGSFALQSNVTAQNGTAVGYLALQNNTTGSANTAIGSSTLQQNTTGQNNTAVGASSLKVSTTGTENVAVGVNSLQANTNGSYNLAVGAQALYNNTRGDYNTAAGNRSLYQNTIGTENAAFGDGALYNTTTGSKNTSVGAYSLMQNSTGFYNTAIGYLAGGYAENSNQFVSTANLSNTTVIGANAQIYASNVVALGGQGGDAVKVGVGTGLPTNTLSVEPLWHRSGTVTTNGTTSIIGTSTGFTPDMVGSIIYIATASNSVQPYARTITGYTSATDITVNSSVPSLTNAQYYINYAGLQVSTNGFVGIGTLTPSASLTVAGDALFKNNTDTTTAFQIQNAAGTEIINVDSVNSKLSLKSADTRTLGSEGFSGFGTCSGTGWTVGGSSATHTGSGYDDLTCSSPSVSASTYYQVTFTVAGNTSVNGDTVWPYIGDTSASDVFDGNGTFSFIANTSTTSSLVFSADPTFNGTISAVSVKTVTISDKPILVVKDADDIVALEVRTSLGYQHNLFVGQDSGKANVGGINNIGIGYLSLQSNTDGYDNIAIGNRALSLNSVGYNNMALGNAALFNNTDGYGNLAIGNGALYKNTSGTFNLAVGQDALSQNTIGSSNLALGYRALNDNIDGEQNVAIGQSALSNNINGAGNIAVGLNSLQYNTIGNSNVGVGGWTLFYNDSGNDNVALGDVALFNNTAGDNNVAIGSHALHSNTADNNVAVGYYALQANTSGFYNVAIGPNALFSNNTGYNNYALGKDALLSNTSGYSNIAIGNASLNGNQIGYDNISVGINSQFNNYDGYYNTTIGRESLFYNSSGVGNTTLGNQSANHTTGNQNTAVGNQALYNNTSGSYNTALGFSSGYQGTQTQFKSLNALQNATTVGAYAQVYQDYTLALGGQGDDYVYVGIGTGTPKGILSVEPYRESVGSVSTTNGSGTVTGSGTSFTSDMIGDKIYIASNSTTVAPYAGIITAVASATSITVSPTVPATYSGADYYVNYTGLQVATNGKVGIGVDAPSAKLTVGGVNTTAAFQVQNAASNQIFTVDSTNSKAILGSANNIDGSLDFNNSANSNTITLVSGATSASYTLTLPTGLGASGDCLKDTTGAGVLGFVSCGGGSSLQGAYDGDTDGSDSIVALTSSDDSIILRNPASSGTDSNQVLTVDQLNTGSLDALVVNNAGTGNILNLQDNGTTVLKVTDGGNLTALGAATGTTGTTEATARTNVTTVTLTAAGSFANNDIILINNAGQDYYTRIVSGGGTTTLTVSPEVSYDASATVTKYLLQNIGATSTDYTTQSNRFFQGYFLGGVVTGAGSTTLSDGSITSTNGLKLQSANGVTVSSPTDISSAFKIQNTSGGSVLSVGTSDNQINFGASATNTIDDPMTSTPTGSMSGPAYCYSHVSGQYLQIVDEGFCNGQITYFDSSTTNYDTTYQFNRTNPTDRLFWFSHATTTPVNPGDASGGYKVSVDNMNYGNSTGEITLYYDSTLLATSSPMSFTDNTWHDMRVVLTGTNIKVYYDSSLVINYTDTTRSLTGNRFGLAGKNGGYWGSTAKVRNLSMSSSSGGVVGSIGLNVYGTTKVQSITNSATAFQVQNGAGVNLLTADTINKRLQIGSSTTDTTANLFVIDSYSLVTDPTGVNGAQYYNSYLKKFRCYQDGAWVNCDQGHTIQDEGTDVIKRSTLNFTGSGVNVTDVLTSTTEYPDAVNASSPLAYWRFESGALTTDSSGNSKTLTSNGTPTETSPIIGYGGAVDMGNGDYYSRADTSLTNLTTYTVEAWFKPTGASSGQTGQILGTSFTSGRIPYTFRQNGSTIELAYYDGSTWRIVHQFTQTVGESYHLVLVNDNGQYYAYVNGGLAASYTGTTGTNAQTDVLIGKRWDNTQYAVGVIDEAAIFNTVLSGATISDRYALRGGDGVTTVTINNSTLQQAYNISTGSTTPEVKLDATRGGLDVQDADTTIAGNLLTVRASNGAGLGAALFSVNSTGQTVFSNTVNSTSAFSVQNANNVNILNIDTTNGELELGSYNAGTNPVNGRLVVGNSTNANTATIVSGATSTSYTLTLPTALGASGDCLKDTTGAGVLGFVSCGGSGSDLQGSYDTGSAGDQVIALTSANDSLIFRNPASSGTDSNQVLTVDQLNTGALDALVVNNAGTGNILNLQDNGTTVLKVTDGGNLTALGAATGTTGTTEATARTNVTTVTLTAAGSFANNDIIFINNAGQDYYTRIVSGGGTTTLTVSPEVSYDVSATVTKYILQNIGATTTDYTTQSNRFFQGYFLGGVVTGAGSTTLSDGSITSTNGLKLQSASGVVIRNSTDNVTALLVQNAAGNDIFNANSVNRKINFGGTAVATTTDAVNDSMTTTPNGNLLNSAAYVSGQYVELNTGSNANGAIEYTPAMNTDYDATFQFYTSGSADAVYFYAFNSSTPTVEDQATGGYMVSFSEYNNAIRLTYNGSILASYSQAGMNNSTWRDVRVLKVGMNTKVYFDSSLVIDYTDTARSLTGTKVGLGARSGGTAGTHRVKNLVVTTPVPTADPIATIDTSNGQTTFKNSTNSTTAFQVQNASGTSVFAINTTDRSVGINTAAPVGALQVTAIAGQYSFGFETGNISPLTDSGSDWTVSGSQANNGTFSATALASNGWSDDTTSALTLSKTLTASGTITFARKMANGYDCGAGCASGGVIFKIDGVTQETATNTSFAYASFNVSSGAHTFTWEVNKTGFGYDSVGGWVDDITVTNTDTNAITAVFTGGNVGINTSAPTKVLDVRGDALFRNSVDSAAAFQIQTAGGTSFFTADSTNSIVTVTNLVVTASLTVNGHIISGNSSGTTTVAAGAAACTTPTVNVSGNDTAGVITVTTGTGCAAGGTLATVTFANAYAAAPVVTVTPQDSASAGLQTYATQGTGTFVLGTNTTATNSTTYKFNYHIIQ